MINFALFVFILFHFLIKKSRIHAMRNGLTDYYGKMEGTPIHLLGSMVMATFVMAYLNMVVGSMGGIPAWLGMMVAFYFAWGRTHYRKKPSEEKGFDEKRLTRVIFYQYLVEYLLVWFGVKTFLLVTNLWGWGSNSGLSIGEYLHALHGETLVEQWAYYFGVIFMLAFILSLFPFIFIPGKHWKIWYLIADGILFWLLNKLVIRICSIWIPKANRASILSLKDALVLCVTTHKWQAGLYLFLAGIVALAVAILSLAFSVMLVKGDRFSFFSKERKRFQFKKWHRAMLLLAAVVTFILLIFALRDVVKNQIKIHKILPVFDDTEVSEEVETEEVNTEVEEPEYEKVAEFMTEDHNFGPMVFRGEFYIPVDMDLDYDTEGEALGYIAMRGQEANEGFLWFQGSNLLYGRTWDNEYVEMEGNSHAAFRKAGLVEEDKRWEDKTLFVIWDEEWLDETAYSKDRTGYCLADRGFIASLEEKFGSPEFRVEDFSDYDAYFTIRAYSDAKLAFGEEVICGEWVGCILVKDNLFYYGNYDNQITGIVLEELLDFLGGNRNVTIDQYEGLPDDNSGVKKN